MPRVAYLSSIGRYTIVVVLDAGRCTESHFVCATRNATAIATASSAFIVKPSVVLLNSGPEMIF
jgi:hypothetical protein